VISRQIKLSETQRLILDLTRTELQKILWIGVLMRNMGLGESNVKIKR